MLSLTEEQNKNLPQIDAGRERPPLATRLAFEIPKPLDWQTFQRQCVVLFIDELGDPNAQEYGRHGQAQGGIDILGRRNGRPDHFVGIQCRRYDKPLKQTKILADARSALKLEAGLKELIFATTAPDDTGATDAALAVERQLRAEGHDLTIALYGWGQLQQMICRHDAAYHAFFPAALATHMPRTAEPPATADLATLIAAQVMEQMRSGGLPVPQQDSGPPSESDEDPALHARIDTFRDLFTEQRLTLQAEKGFQRLLERESLADKPYARFRIETNLGSIAIDLGREADAAERFEAAYKMRRDDPKAIANLALARTIQGRYAEAMEAASAAMTAEPRVDDAVAYLLQAAARSDWEGDPEALIPDDLVGSLAADLGLVEFLRRRDLPGWAERTIEIARRHPDAPDLVRARGVAVLSLAIESGTMIPGGFGPITVEELNSTADDLKAVAEHCLDIELAHRHDLIAYVNNAAVLLRLCERFAESERLLLAALPRVGDEPQLRRLCAFVQSAQNRTGDALALLADDTDPENQVLRAELRATQGQTAEALRDILAIDEESLDERLQAIRWRLVGEMALRMGNDDQLARAVAALRASDPEDITASLLEIRGSRKRIEDAQPAQEKMLALAASAQTDLSMTARYQLADELRNHDLPDAAANLLEGHVDLGRPSPATELYLQSLAGARRDEAFGAALARTSPDVRNSLQIRWVEATHAWNMDDLPASLSAVEAILAEHPSETRARLLKLEILVRQNCSAGVFAELDKPLETLVWRDVQNLFRVASLLGHFGYVERAAALAYRLFLEHRDLSQAWMTLSTLVLEEGRGDGEIPGPWTITTVGPNAAVKLRYVDGTETFFVVEPDIALRRLDADSWEPNHALARCLAGRGTDQAFTGPDGREGTIIQVTHKYVARLHHVMEHHSTRFPEIFGFKSVAVDFEQPNGLDGLIAQLKARHDWITREEENYVNGFMLLGVLADRVGADTIDVSGGLAARGVALKVTAGNAVEREATTAAIQEHGQRGCVLDLLAFWTCWRLGALDAVVATCGPIRVPRSVIDRLRARRERLRDGAIHGHQSAGYLPDGRISVTETPAETFTGLIDDIDHAIAWLEGHAEIAPLVISDTLPAELRNFLKNRRTDALDAVALAVQGDTLLITNDLPAREFLRILTGTNGAWVHAVIGAALEAEHIDMDAYVRWSAWLIEAGHSYLGVNAPALAHAARLEGVAAMNPGSLFTTLSRVIGGTEADAPSHLNVCVMFMFDLWRDWQTAEFRKPVTGHLLDQLLRGRRHDYTKILRTALTWARDLPDLYKYIRDWTIGHFVADNI